jgi:thioredoxin 1
MKLYALHVKDKKMKKVIRFTASWCEPCKMLAKTLEDVQTNLPIEIVDIDKDSNTAIEFGIRGVPTMVMVEDGAILKRSVGMKSLKELQEWFND